MAIDEALSGAETEAMLLQLTRDVTPAVRGAAVSALGECPPPALWKVIWRDWNTWKQIEKRRVMLCPMFCEISSPTEKHMNRLYHGVFRSSWLIMFDSLMQEFDWQSFSHPLFNRESAGDVNHLHPVGRTGSTRIYKSIIFANYLSRQLHFWKMKFPNWQSRFGSGSMWVPNWTTRFWVCSALANLWIWRRSQQASGRCLDAVVRVRLRFYEAVEKQDSQCMMLMTLETLTIHAKLINKNKNHPTFEDSNI